MTRESTGKLVPIRRVDGATEEMSDEALLAGCAVGERAALGALFDRHHRVVYRFIARASLATVTDADDLVQTTFVEVWSSAGRYRGKGKPSSWIIGIAANVVRHYVRSEVRRRLAMTGLAECPYNSAARPDDAAERRQLVAHLGDALAKLPHDLRVAFVLCDLEHMSGVDAARALGVRQGTMWRRLHDARKRLRAALDEGPT